ncbi:uncharacterized protein LOC110895538 [Helianthus annuus]|uniref:uncharacterized protein LOC110895538 n=1 Tax=Helianthus annuus TaxID=4232 RepID=UPI000B8FA256|nr:uncharacterized protein LOC110895538 [Helianthus annuus]
MCTQGRLPSYFPDYWRMLIIKYVSFCCFGYIPEMITPLPLLPNIEYLEFHGSITHGSIVIFQTLQTCSMLKHLTIGQLDQSVWVVPKSPPSCVVKSLESLKINHVGTQSVDFVLYTLQNARRMKTLEIVC